VLLCGTSNEEKAASSDGNCVATAGLTTTLAQSSSPTRSVVIIDVTSQVYLSLTAAFTPTCALDM